MTKPSSNVKAVTHDPITNVLTVHFLNGGIYDYAGVTKAQHAALIKAPSRGSWVAENLVKKLVAHPSTKVSDKKK